MNEKISIVFFGSGPVAEKSLTLLQNNFFIEAIITKKSTEQEMRTISPGTSLFTVSNGEELDSLLRDNDFKSTLAILIDFGIIVSQFVIDKFEKGIVNSHFSLLPELRGADPISFAILEGKKITGASLMLLAQAMDEGPILSTSKLSLSGKETNQELTERLIKLSDNLILDIIPKYINDEIEPKVQKNSGISYTRKLTKSDGIINWSKPAETIEREIRAYSEWPKCRTNFNGIDVIITKSALEKNLAGEKIGKILIKNKELFVYTSTCALKILNLKPAGKKEMTAEAFIAGYGNRL